MHVCSQAIKLCAHIDFCEQDSDFMHGIYNLLWHVGASPDQLPSTWHVRDVFPAIWTNPKLQE